MSKTKHGDWNGSAGGPLYRPYGALEMKMTYQRNMSIGTLTAVMLTVLVLAVAYVWPEGPLDVDGPVRGGAAPDTISVTLEQQSIKYDAPEIEVSAPPRSVDAEGYIPTPVADEEFAQDEDPLIPTSEELAVIGSGGTPDGSEDGGGLYVDGNAVGGLAFEEPPKFQVLEIYPKMIEQYYGKYPRIAAQAGMEGEVHVQVLLDEEGKPVKAELYKSSGVGSLDEAALEWALRCTFSPGIQNGRAITVWVSFSYEFELEG